MKESQISDALRESMNAVRLSPALRARALCAMRGRPTLSESEHFTETEEWLFFFRL